VVCLLTQQVSQSLGDRFFEDVIIQFMKEFFPVRSAVDKSGDPLRHGER